MLVIIRAPQERAGFDRDWNARSAAVPVYTGGEGEQTAQTGRII
jgi:hypothetical protein